MTSRFVGVRLYPDIPKHQRILEFLDEHVVKDRRGARVGPLLEDILYQHVLEQQDRETRGMRAAAREEAPRPARRPSPEAGAPGRDPAPGGNGAASDDAVPVAPDPDPGRAARLRRVADQFPDGSGDG